MCNSFFRLKIKINKLKNNRKYSAIFDVVYFSIILILVHYAYSFWAKSGYPPIKDLVSDLFHFASSILFQQSIWVINHLTNIDFWHFDQTIYFNSKSGVVSFVSVEPGCTSLKQWTHWVILMILFPGPKIHKVWYIPVGIIIIHFINLFRVTGLVITTFYWPYSFDFFHSYIFKTFFYFVIFIMWVIWVEYFKIPKLK